MKETKTNPEAGTRRKHHYGFDEHPILRRSDGEGGQWLDRTEAPAAKEPKDDNETTVR